MEISNKQNSRGDKKISIAVMSSFVVLTFQYLLLIYFNLMDTSTGSIIQLFSKLIVGVFYVIALPTVLKRSRFFFFSAYFIGITIYIFNFLAFSQNLEPLIDTIFPFFFTSLPTFVYVYSLNDWGLFMKSMKKTSGVVFFISCLIALLVFVGNNEMGEYSMSLSYYMLLPLIVFLNELFEKFKVMNVLYIVVSGVIILALGSRGAILCVLVFIILKSITQLKRLSYLKFLIYLFLLCIMVFGIFFLDEILQFSYEFLSNNFGIQSRTLQLFQEESLYLSQRDVMYNSVLSEIVKHPFVGLGVAGDRIFAGGVYVHNIFIEFFAHFGIILGSFLLFGLLFMILFALKTQGIKKQTMIIMWLCLGLVPLFVSSSYLIEFKFWILMGLVCQSVKFRKY
ncbi:O-antigen ligase family protein [Tetragenococcus halophilus]|uniref:O-antigen ligase family protein n=1 Tax=Tetragenococcus halophilus TaxID=51669 RepID=UPI00209AF0C3|nr:O-antigen ligase family protein [Tetragenococcus halophilus]MCO8291383.1 hypothetical protein [Tetragenococcus halophilus]